MNFEEEQFLEVTWHDSFDGCWPLWCSRRLQASEVLVVSFSANFLHKMVALLKPLFVDHLLIYQDKAPQDADAHFLLVINDDDR